MDDVRSFYSIRLCSVRRKADSTAGENVTATSPPGSQNIPSDMLRLLRRVIMAVVEVVDKGIAFDEALSKSVRVQLHY